MPTKTDIIGPLRDQRGIALLLTLVILVLLTAIIVEFDYGAKVNLITAGNFRDETQAVYLAQAGVTAARALLKDDVNNSQSDDLDEVWAQPIPPYPVGEGFVSGKITDEAGKIDVNRLGNSNSTVVTVTRNMVMRLFQVLEVDPAQIPPLAEAIQNWVDPDPLHDCPEDSYYERQDPPYQCKKAPMDTLSELLLIKGMTPGIYQKIRPHLTTVSSPSKPVNINTATTPVLQSLDVNISSDTARCIQDNRPYTNLDSFFGCGQAVGACVVGSPCRTVIDVRSSYFSVEAHGNMHETERIVTALLNRSGKNVVLLSWEGR